MTELVPTGLINGNGELEKINHNPSSPDNTQSENRTLEKLSETNIERLLSGFLTKSVSSGVTTNPDLLREEIMLEASEMAKKYFFTINLSDDSVARLLQVGKIETIWDHPNIDVLQTSANANNKSLPDDYLNTRRAAENGLREFVSDDNKNKSPISTALATDEDDMIEGAAPRYGNWAVFITPTPEIVQKTVFSFEDSFRSVNSKDFQFDDKNVLDLKDAFTAKAIHKKIFEKFLDANSKKRIHKLRNYVEAVIFSDITLSDISFIVCSLNNKDEINNAKTILNLIKPIKDKVHFVFGEKIPLADREPFN